jgi:hypothetical protein
MAPSSKSHFKLILSTKCDEELLYDTSFPSMAFDDAKDSTTGQQLYCHDVGKQEALILAFKVRNRTGSNVGNFTIEFGARRSWSTHPVSSQKFVNPTCTLSLDTDPSHPLDVPEKYDEVNEDIRKDLGTGEAYRTTGTLTGTEPDVFANKTERRDSISDRALGQLSCGNVIYAAAKADFDAITISREGVFRPYGYTLLVTLLGGGDGEGSSVDSGSVKEGGGSVR